MKGIFPLALLLPLLVYKSPPLGGLSLLLISIGVFRASSKAHIDAGYRI